MFNHKDIASAKPVSDIHFKPAWRLDRLDGNGPETFSDAELIAVRVLLDRALEMLNYDGVEALSPQLVRVSKLGTSAFEKLVSKLNEALED